jgi:uncharacterized membrane protein YkoI
MKKLGYAILSAVALASLAISSAPAQTKKAEAKQPAAQGKITKADAERLVQQKNPGLNILNSTEATVNGHQVWSVSVATTGGNVARKVYVDQETGKLSY